MAGSTDKQDQQLMFSSKSSPAQLRQQVQKPNNKQKIKHQLNNGAFLSFSDAVQNVV